MSEEREQLQQAQALIEQKEYEAAREILQTMSTNPTAHQWLKQNGGRNTFYCHDEGPQPHRHGGHGLN